MRRKIAVAAEALLFLAMLSLAATLLFGIPGGAPRKTATESLESPRGEKEWKRLVRAEVAARVLHSAKDTAWVYVFLTSMSGDKEWARFHNRELVPNQKFAFADILAKEKTRVRMRIILWTSDGLGLVKFPAMGLKYLTLLYEKGRWKFEKLSDTPAPPKAEAPVPIPRPSIRAAGRLFYKALLALSRLGGIDFLFALCYNIPRIRSLKSFLKITVGSQRSLFSGSFASQPWTQKTSFGRMQ